jgi:hypothetical protein
LKLQRLFYPLLPLTVATISPAAQPNAPISIHLDISDAPRKLFHASLVIPVQPGPLTLVYPKWIPGEHAPTGPIDELAGIFFSGNGTPIPWHRDDVDMYTLHLVIPPGVTRLEAKLDFLATGTKWLHVGRVYDRESRRCGLECSAPIPGDCESGRPSGITIADDST